MTAPLNGAVVVVTGASRDIGKGIALELGAAGATVYVTGRTTSPGGALPGTVGGTAEEIDALGGRGVPVVCDHHDDGQVKALFGRVASEHGQLDVLANNVYSASDLVPWLNRPFWQIPPETWDQVIASELDLTTSPPYSARLSCSAARRASS